MRGAAKLRPSFLLRVSAAPRETYIPNNQSMPLLALQALGPAVCNFGNGPPE